MTIKTGLLLLSSVVVTATSLAAVKNLSDVIKESFDFSATQYSGMLDRLSMQTGFPRTFVDGKLATGNPTNWTSGFFPGSLWFLYEYTGEEKWKKSAIKYTEALKEMKDYKKTHDLGFVLYCSYGNGYRLTGDAGYGSVVIDGAHSLRIRFNPTVGCIKSWDHGDWKYPVIIDNLMNLEMLTWASRAAPDPKLNEIAITHADTTLLNHYRPDHSSYHVVGYDPETGKVEVKQTHQGAADNSAWARGQTWGLYGYTMMYRETRKPVYLDQAKAIAGFLISHPRLPADKVPYWDFDAKDIPNAPRDASAAAIMCSGLIELSGYVDKNLAKQYLAVAEQQLRSLSSDSYRAKLGENGSFILMHSTGNYPQHADIDVPLNYADYYYLEAMLRYKKLLGGSAKAAN